MNAILAYIPPKRMNSESFLRNLAHYKTQNTIIYYSDCNTPLSVNTGKYIEIPDPTAIKMSKNRVAIHNRIFLHGLEISQRFKLKRFIYLESDCRVGCDGWDERMLSEAEQYRDMFVAGTPAIYNSKGMPHAQEIAAQHYCLRYKSSTGLGVPVFESKTKRPVGCPFIMGALAVYNTDVAADLFMGFERDAFQKAQKVPAFDLHIGIRCTQLFGARAVDKLPFLTCSFSTYGSKVNSESDRVEMLRSGRFCAVHQIKSNNDCIWSKT